MMSRAGIAALLFSASSVAAAAAELPQLKSSPSNTVPACATPGRLMSFAKARNDKLDVRFDGIATEYMRHGEELSIRWDYAFFQMLVETGNLSFKGDVKPKQNNFAGLGATGGGEPGESFKDVSTGVRAHLEHILMYSGERVANPTAERTRKVQEWGVLTSWQKTIKGPMTFSQLTRKWSPHDKGYGNDIDSVAQSFLGGACKGPDPRPELVAEARKGRAGVTVAAVDAKQKSTNAASTSDDGDERLTGAEIARRAVEEARASGATRSGLGAAALARSAEQNLATSLPSHPETPKAQPAVKIINAPAVPDTPVTAVEVPQRASEPKAADAMKDGTGKKPAAGATQLASVGGAAKQLAPPAAAAASTAKCRVWTASYGGPKAIIIKAVKDNVVNFTVLDVNEGAEKREAEAYIGAYAKGGEPVGEFANQDQALDKAFELCPEG